MPTRVRLLPRLLAVALALALARDASAATYYVNTQSGQDTYPGTSTDRPLQTLARASRLDLQPGDEILLAAGQVFRGSLMLRAVPGRADKPVVIGSYGEGGSGDGKARATIDARGWPAAIWLADPHAVVVRDLALEANAGGMAAPSTWSRMRGERAARRPIDLRCGVLVTTTRPGRCGAVTLERLWIHDVFYEEPGFTRPKSEVHSANGTQRYGWGIRFLNELRDAAIEGVTVRDCLIENTSHTGLKFTTPSGGIQDVAVLGNTVRRTGGPGMQLSGVDRGLFRGNSVDRSGSDDDSRKWGRGSGLWTWGCTGVLIEHNRFTNAHGPGDSAGCHIDFNCRDVVVQYNVSARNAGGFIEILGNNHNCAYRYNVSIDDGFRVKGRDGAFQEGKVFWLSGFVGSRQPHRGPFNSYIYNNTVYVRDSIVAKVAIGPSTQGVLVANNIFCLVGPSRDVAGDQYNAEQAHGAIPRVRFENNLYLRKDNWPAEASIQDAHPLFGDPRFRQSGSLEAADYVPANVALVADQGIEIPRLPGDEVGLKIGLKVTHDILGHPIRGRPDLGAIEVK